MLCTAPVKPVSAPLPDFGGPTLEPYCTAIDVQRYDTTDCEIIEVRRECWSDGSRTVEYFNLTTQTILTEEEFSGMATNILPMGEASKTCERVDTLPFEIVGAAGPFTYAEVLANSLAAAAAAYPTFGDAAATDAVLAINIYGLTAGDHVLHNGAATPQVIDEDGVNMANVIEVPEGCTVRVTFCLQRCLTKAEVAAL